MLMPVTVNVPVMMIVMLEARRSPVPLPCIGMTGVKRMDLLQMMMMVVYVIQTTVGSGVGVRRRGLARYPGADVVMVHAGVSG